MFRFLETVLARKRLRDLLLPLSLLATSCVHNLFAQCVAEEQSSLTYHSTGSEVRLVFFATDEHNRLIRDLHQDDLAVVDNEMVIRDFRSFSRSALPKLDVVVLIDSSESVQPRFQQEIADVLHVIAQWPSSPGDKVSVLTFSGVEVRLICAGDCRNSLTSDRLASYPKGGATPLFDAIEMAATSLMQRRQPEVWPVIILLSDGQDTVSRASFKEASERLFASEAQVYAIDLSHGARPDNGTATLQRLADDSGGRYVRVSQSSAAILNDVMTDVIEDLHSARVVTYALPESGSDFHPVRILPTHNLTWQFRCRRGYYSHASNGNSENSP